MKALPFLLLAVYLSGCSLLPHSVEYFQKKVRAVPQLGDAAIERQKEAAEYVARKTAEVEHLATSFHSDPELLLRATEAHTVADSLSDSLGKPLSPTQAPATNIAAALDHDSAKLDKALDKYRDKVEPLVGKKIEGTGVFQLGYFTNLGLILLIPVLIWVGLKIYGVFNPVVGLGTNIVGRVASKTLALGFRQVVGAGERFKEYLSEHKISDTDKQAILDLFTRAHQEHQDEHVQELIKSMTK